MEHNGTSAINIWKIPPRQK